MKLRVVELLIISTIPAMILAEKGVPSFELIIATLVGGTLAAGSANAFNMVLESDLDKLMERTSERPLVTGALSKVHATIFATVIGALPVVVSIVMMLVSSLMAFRKARVLRRAILASVPNLMQEMTIGWILYHAFLDAFVIQKPVFHRELKYASTNLTSLNIRTFETAYVFFGVY